MNIARRTNTSASKVFRCGVDTDINHGATGIEGIEYAVEANIGDRVVALLKDIFVRHDFEYSEN